jgi:hypothetical protein
MEKLDAKISFATNHSQFSSKLNHTRPLNTAGRSTFAPFFPNAKRRTVHHAPFATQTNGLLRAFWQ